MRLRAALRSLPEGYELVRGRRGWLAVARDARSALERAGFGPDGGEALSESDLSGRRPLFAIQPGPDDAERWVVRRFHHGGLLRALGEDLFLEPARPFDELRLAHELSIRGLATPRVIAARATRSGLGWRLALVTVRIEGTRDAAQVLERMRLGELAPAERRRFLQALGTLVGRLHAHGFLHADLHPRNVLLWSDLATCWILDLDRARFVPDLRHRTRRDNLRRLYRSVRRREARGRRFLSRCDYRRFLAAYVDAVGELRTGRGDWRADWRAIVRRDQRRAPFHRLGWWLEGWLGAGPEQRDGAAVPRA